MNISPSNTFHTTLFPERFHQNRQTAFCRLRLEKVYNSNECTVLTPTCVSCNCSVSCSSKSITDAQEFLWKFSSASMILLAITLELRIILQNISRRVVGYVLMNVSPSNIFQIMLVSDRFLQNRQAALLLATASKNRLNNSNGCTVLTSTHVSRNCSVSCSSESIDV